MQIGSSGSIILRTAAAGTKPVKIFLAGDTNIRSLGEKLVLAGKSHDILAPMTPLFQQADLSIIQFETVLTRDDTPIEKSGPNLRSDPDSIEFFREWNGDLCLMANNHTGDFGPEALTATMDQLHANGFQTVGAGKNLEEAYRPCIVERQGIKIGVLNVAENEFGGALPDRAGSAPMNPMLQVRQILALRPQVDVLMVVTHGGNEQCPFPSPRVVDMSRTFVEVGADIVVNIHTHCPQGIEVWKGKPIVYSTGNFYFPWRDDDVESYSPENFWFTGYCVMFNVDVRGCHSLEVVPTYVAPDASRVAPLAGRQRERFFDYLQKLSDAIADDGAIRAYHEAWAASSGYAARLKEPVWNAGTFTGGAPEQRRIVMMLRNLMTCEAHSEVLRTHLRLIEQHRLEEAMAPMEAVRGFMKASFMVEND